MKATKGDVKANPGLSLDLLAAMSGETRDQILKRCTSSILEALPPNLENNSVFWMGVVEGMEYVLTDIAKHMDAFEMHEKIFFAVGLESARLQIEKLKN